MTLPVFAFTFAFTTRSPGRSSARSPSPRSSASSPGWSPGLAHVVLTTVHLGFLAAVATSVVGGVLGVLLATKIATGRDVIPAGGEDAHPATMVVGFLIPVGMALAEWGLRGTALEPAGRLGRAQIGAAVPRRRAADDRTPARHRRPAAPRRADRARRCRHLLHPAPARRCAGSTGEAHRRTVRRRRGAGHRRQHRLRQLPGRRERGRLRPRPDPSDPRPRPHDVRGRPDQRRVRHVDHRRRQRVPVADGRRHRVLRHERRAARFRGEPDRRGRRGWSASRRRCSGPASCSGSSSTRIACGPAPASSRPRSPSLRAQRLSCGPSPILRAEAAPQDRLPPAGSAVARSTRPSAARPPARARRGARAGTGGRSDRGYSLEAETRRPLQPLRPEPASGPRWPRRRGRTPRSGAPGR